MRARKAAGLIVALLAVTVLSAGCGDDDDSETFPPITVEGTEMAFSPSTFKLEAGQHPFLFVNKGTVDHELAIRPVGGEGLGRVSAKPGEEATLDVDLKKGEYEMVCQEPGHLEAGMRADITVQ